MIETIGISVNTDKPESVALARETIDLLKTLGKVPVLLSAQKVAGLDGLADYLEADAFFNTADCVIVFGGDGTLLSVARKCATYDTELFGINTGKLGFLTEGEGSGYKELIARLLDGDTVLDERMMLECVVHLGPERDKRFLALNDVVIKSSAMRLIRIKVHVGRRLLGTFRADGLIVSTPTGSTAYSLAASGPIVHPSADVLIINPICPQNLYDRPFILPAYLPLKISFEAGEHEILVSMDGQEDIRIDGTDYIEVAAAEEKTRLLRLTDSSYYDRIRSKLYDIK